MLCPVGFPIMPGGPPHLDTDAGVLGVCGVLPYEQRLPSIHGGSIDAPLIPKSRGISVLSRPLASEGSSLQVAVIEFPNRVPA